MKTSEISIANLISLLPHLLFKEGTASSQASPFSLSTVYPQPTPTSHSQPLSLSFSLHHQPSTVLFAIFDVHTGVGSNIRSQADWEPVDFGVFPERKKSSSAEFFDHPLRRHGKEPGPRWRNNDHFFGSFWEQSRHVYESAPCSFVLLCSSANFRMSPAHKINLWNPPSHLRDTDDKSTRNQHWIRSCNIVTKEAKLKHTHDSNPFCRGNGAYCKVTHFRKTLIFVLSYFWKKKPKFYAVWKFLFVARPSNFNVILFGGLHKYEN